MSNTSKTGKIVLRTRSRPRWEWAIINFLRKLLRGQRKVLKLVGGFRDWDLV